MAHQLEPDPSLISPEYWDGIDITEDSNFDLPREPYITVARRDYKWAAVGLRQCLENVLQGDYTEIKSHHEPVFDPSPAQLADGVVVTIDREHLMKWTYPEEKIWNPRQEPVEEPFRSEQLADYWRSKQPQRYTHDPEHFSDERVVFADQHITYGRHLVWGVILTNKVDHRQMATWGFGVPRHAGHGLVAMPSTPPAVFRPAELLPVAVGVAQPAREHRTDTYALRSIKRVRQIRIIHPASGVRERAPSLSQRAQAAIEAIGNVAVPNPSPLPA